MGPNNLNKNKGRTFALSTCSALLINAAISSFTPVFAQDQASPCPWIFSGGLGEAKYANTSGNAGQTAIGRLAIGKEMYKSDEMAFGSELSFGLEVGLQSGNRMRLDVPLVDLGIRNLAIQSTVKPIIDVLATLRTNTLENAALFTQMKAGVAYRQWQFDDLGYSATLTQIAPELQLGIGYLINERAFATLSYQGVFGGSPELTVDTATLTAHVKNIPSQNAILLGISFTI